MRAIAHLHIPTNSLTSDQLWKQPRGQLICIFAYLHICIFAYLHVAHLHIVAAAARQSAAANWWLTCCFHWGKAATLPPANWLAISRWNSRLANWLNSIANDWCSTAAIVVVVVVVVVVVGSAEMGRWGSFAYESAALMASFAYWTPIGHSKFRIDQDRFNAICILNLQ